jgi:hypothetical protein
MRTEAIAGTLAQRQRPFLIHVMALASGAGKLQHMIAAFALCAVYSTPDRNVGEMR